MTKGEISDRWRVKLDWLNLTFPAAARGAVQALASEYLGQGTDEAKGLHFYRYTHKWEAGGLLAWTDAGAINGDTCLLSLNGDSLDFLPAIRLHRFIRSARALGAQASRLDLAFDDFTRQILQMDHVHAAARAGNFTGARVHRMERESKRSGELVGDSHYFGRAGKDGSGRLVVFYDKALESRGEIDAVRMEARFFKEIAAGVFTALASAESVEQMEGRICKHIGGSLSFVERGTHKHVSRMPLLDWWSRLLDVLGSARVRIDRIIPPLQSALEYQRDTWALSYALAFEIAESQGLDGSAHVNALAMEMVERGKKKLDAGRRLGARDLGLDFARLLSS